MISDNKMPAAPQQTILRSRAANSFGIYHDLVSVSGSTARPYGDVFASAVMAFNFADFTMFDRQLNASSIVGTQRKSAVTASTTFICRFCGQAEWWPGRSAKSGMSCRAKPFSSTPRSPSVRVSRMRTMSRSSWLAIRSSRSPQTRAVFTGAFCRDHRRLDRRYRPVARAVRIGPFEQKRGCARDRRESRSHHRRDTRSTFRRRGCDRHGPAFASGNLYRRSPRRCAHRRLDCARHRCVPKRIVPRVPRERRHRGPHHQSTGRTAPVDDLPSQDDDAPRGFVDGSGLCHGRSRLKGVPGTLRAAAKPTSDATAFRPPGDRFGSRSASNGRMVSCVEPLIRRSHSVTGNWPGAEAPRLRGSVPSVGWGQRSAVLAICDKPRLVGDGTVDRLDLLLDGLQIRSVLPAGGRIGPARIPTHDPLARRLGDLRPFGL